MESVQYMGRFQFRKDRDRFNCLLMSKSREIPWQVERYIEESLSRLGNAVQTLADRIDGKISVREHNRPKRIIMVCHDGMMKKIEIGAAIRDIEKGWDSYYYHATVFAWQDIRGGRAIWVQDIVSIDEIPKDDKKNMQLIEKCWKALLKVKEKDLKIRSNLRTKTGQATLCLGKQP